MNAKELGDAVVSFIIENDLAKIDDPYCSIESWVDGAEERIGQMILDTIKGAGR